MSKFRISVIATALAIAASAVVGSAVQAAPSYLQAATPAPAAFTVGELLQIKPSVPFSWLRNLPASTAAVIDTAKANEFVIVASPAPQSDGVQWWWAVRRGSGSVTGWIEEQALQPAVNSPTATATLAPGVLPAPTLVPSTGWTNGTAVTITTGVPFIWIRTSPSSAAPVRVVAYRNALLTIRDANPVSDGTQLWWLVNYPLLNLYGWVEQRSLVTTVNNPTPVPTSSAPIVVPTVGPVSAATAVPSTPVPPTSVPSASSFAKWGVPGIVHIRQTVGFAWLRVVPGGAIAQTLLSGSMLLLKDAPTFDGVQYWWPVQTTGNQTGWIEQNSLELVVSFGPIPTGSALSVAAPTVTPTPGS
jgi:hypothetical protein